MLSRRSLLVSALSGCAALTACGGGSDSAPAPAPAPAPVPAPTPPSVPLPPLITDTEVRVSGDTPFAPGCSGSAPGTEYRNAEVEPQVAVNPLNPGNLVVSWQQDRWLSGGASGIVSAVSFDGGATWSSARVCGFALRRRHCGQQRRLQPRHRSLGHVFPQRHGVPDGTGVQRRFSATGFDQCDARGSFERRRSLLECGDSADRQRQQLLQRQEQDHGGPDRCPLRLCGVGPARACRRRPVPVGAHDRRRRELGGGHRHLRPRDSSRRR